MAKAKSPAKKAATATGMVTKTGIPGSFGKTSSVLHNKNFSSSKKGGMQSIPRKAK
ncbi:MAG: hypothetical protein ABIX01_22490 [Chitinophagaceae bacterium]